MASVLEHLGRVCLQARTEAQVRQIDVSTVAGVSHTIISRFETGGGIPRNLDRLVSAYGSECEADPFDLWMQALHQWRDETNP